MIAFINWYQPDVLEFISAPWVFKEKPLAQFRIDAWLVKILPDRCRGISYRNQLVFSLYWQVFLSTWTEIWPVSCFPNSPQPSTRYPNAIAYSFKHHLKRRVKTRCLDISLFWIDAFLSQEKRYVITELPKYSLNHPIKGPASFALVFGKWVGYYKILRRNYLSRLNESFSSIKMNEICRTH